jgi:hypothetical protein
MEQLLQIMILCDHIYMRNTKKYSFISNKLPFSRVILTTRAISDHVSPHDGQFHVGTSFVTDGQTDGQCTTRLIIPVKFG